MNNLFVKLLPVYYFGEIPFEVLGRISVQIKPNYIVKSIDEHTIHCDHLEEYSRGLSDLKNGDTIVCKLLPHLCTTTLEPGDLVCQQFNPYGIERIIIAPCYPMVYWRMDSRYCVPDNWWDISIHSEEYIKVLCCLES
jgi:hypothetical protein